MINTEIWISGTNPELDTLFHNLREDNLQDSDHPLYKNYTRNNFENCEALSITFDNSKPVCCSSIIHKNFWPNGAYRILNRFWKVQNERFSVLNINTKMLRISNMIKCQLEYSQNVLNSTLVFISRHETNWQQFLIDSIRSNTGDEWKQDTVYKYQTCLTPGDDTCWQQIIYFGNKDNLSTWNRK